MKFHINLEGNIKTETLTELARKIDAEIAGITNVDGVHDWSIESDSATWEWTETGGEWITK